jgi:hypothetical protein
MTAKSINQSKKKEEFTKNTGSNKPIIIAILLILVIGAAAAGFFYSSSKTGNDASLSGEPSARTRSYIGRVVSMTTIEPSIEGDWVNIPLSLLEENDIVYFEVENNAGFMVPLMAYITPSGRIFTGSSMCEPCAGRYFSLAGETLVCDTCRTTYTIEGREFISGSQDCGSYPPVAMRSKVENDLVSVALEDILVWRIRAY